MRASTWGDRNAPFIVIPPPVTLAQFEASKREIAAGWRLQPSDPEEDRKDRVISYQRKAMILALVAMVCFGLAYWFK
ncbi:hypothetical protein ABR33_06105 [Enterobacter bugandensis]|uniref:hypothetical protein n=1 Tax=Enterobacter bugandensis TaxID=881260 RepID=UPI0006433FA2|nr:hypothetical protein [Enterobacter bugandensis]KLQ32562.1 hypothetical protein ABR33_06105 [Enterobacter bugandensis]